MKSGFSRQQRAVVAEVIHVQHLRTASQQLRCVVESIAWLLGSDPEIQVATNVSNHLTSAVLKYFSDAGRHGPAVNLFEKLVVKDGEMASLLARSYIGMGRFDH